MADRIPEAEQGVLGHQEINTQITRVTKRRGGSVFVKIKKRRKKRQVFTAFF